MTKPTPAIGIDLGTTFSAIAWLDDLGRPEILVNAEGDKLTPSAVLFEGEDVDGTNVIVGKEAIKALATEADDVALRAKRHLGARYFHRPLGGRQYPPEAIEAWILQKLCRDASRQIGPIAKAVITVPAYFDDVRRKATQDAGYMAGLEVLDIINEPTAAAIAFGFRQAVAHGEPDDARPQNILVYDLGGGTFDVTVLEICGANFTALATDGDVALGGYDWDQRLIDHVVDQFNHKFDVDVREDANAMGRLWRECEDAKRTLSVRQKASIACDHGGHALRVEVTRADFESMTQDLLERTAFTTRETLAASELTWHRLDRVLLVGGSTRMPAVVTMLRELSGQEPDTSISPDEAVAFGAALRAGFLLAEQDGEEATRRGMAYRIKNVNSHSLGVVGTDPDTRRKRNAILIPRNTPLPVTTRRVFKTQKPNQRSILVPIVEGESHDPEQCVPIGECIVPSLPPDLPAQTPIDVSFKYKENGRLMVRVTVDGGFDEPSFHLERSNTMSQEDLDRWRRHISKVPPPA
jgi:molecular chaperone DnaK